MARRQFEVIDVVEVLQHWHAGRPKSVVASSLGVDAKTMRKYVNPAEEAGLVPGGPSLSRGEWSELVRDWFPELVDARARSATHVVIDAHRDRIKTMLETNTVATVHQRLRDEHGLAVGITSFRAYVAASSPATGPGTGHGAPSRGPGRAKKPRSTTACSGAGSTRRAARAADLGLRDGTGLLRHMFVRPVIRLDETPGWRPTLAAFDYFGGVPRRLVPDNLATGVTKADLYDPKINRAYAELAAHYQVLVDPARARKPKDKPRVERPMRYIRDSFWRGREWRDEAHMQEAALPGASRWPVGVTTAPSEAPSRRRVPRRRGAASSVRCRRLPSSWPGGPPPRWAPTATPKWEGPLLPALPPGSRPDHRREASVTGRPSLWTIA